MKTLVRTILFMAFAVSLTGCLSLLGVDTITQIETDGKVRAAQAAAQAQASAAASQADATARGAEARAVASVERAEIWADKTPTVVAILVLGAIITTLASIWGYVNRNKPSSGTDLALTIKRLTAQDIAMELINQMKEERERQEKWQRESVSEPDGYVVEVPFALESPQMRLRRMNRGN